MKKLRLWWYRKSFQLRHPKFYYYLKKEDRNAVFGDPEKFSDFKVTSWNEWGEGIPRWRLILADILRIIV